MCRRASLDWSSISRALLASDISASRSKLAEPTSAGSRPAPSLPSRSSPTSSAVEISIWLSNRAMSSVSAAFTSSSSSDVHGSSP